MWKRTMPYSIVSRELQFARRRGYRRRTGVRSTARSEDRGSLVSVDRMTEHRVRTINMQHGGRACTTLKSSAATG